MNSLSRALFSLSRACSSTGRIAARSFSEAAAGGSSSSAAAAAEGEGAKAKLFSILSAASEPLTSAQVWEAAEPLGLKSKRFTKEMLAQLRKAGYVVTKPHVGAAKGKKHAKSFGYQLRPTTQQAQRRQQRSAP